MATQGSWFQDSDFVFVTMQHAESLRSSTALRNDVIFTQRGTLGQVGLIPDCPRYPAYILSQSQMKMSCADWVPPEYVFLTFRQPESVERFVACAATSGVPHVNLDFLRTFPVLIPDRMVLQAFAQRIRPWSRALVGMNAESNSLATLRNTLLPKLLSGEIRIRDAEKTVESAL